MVTERNWVLVLPTELLPRCIGGGGHEKSKNGLRKWFDTDCPIEWFHFQCVGLSAVPSGEWVLSQSKLSLCSNKICRVFQI